ncbi:meiotic cell cortex C-terminal pleckstrin homology-domain-containing protein [Choanephora cucurbitarum]|nr:meiotic cell cortex C-terminal pleckstrin homology-domain-containing protein [Choanephora cucurbitarum]
MKFLEESLKKENDLKSFAFSDKKNNQQSSNAPAVDFNTQVSLDLLLKPLSKDQIQEVLAALTRCIIGEWVWKYTRKVVGVGFSEKKHRRFFWINPYTRVLHWSTHKPGSSAQAHSKSAFVESFRIICDNKKASTVPYLLIKTSERNVKIQCLDLDCHYSWVKSLSALPTDLSYKKKQFEDEEAESVTKPSSSFECLSKPDSSQSNSNNNVIALPQEPSSDVMCSSSTLIDFPLDINEPLIDLNILKKY